MTPSRTTLLRGPSGAGQASAGARRTRSLLGAAQIAGLVLAAFAQVFSPGHAFGAGPSVTIPLGPFANGQTIAVAGSGFPSSAQDQTGLQIIECSDPNGSPANLPNDSSSCEGITINQGAIDTRSDGTFRAQYQVTELSNSSTGNSSIDCDAVHVCVLWVGTDYSAAFLSGPHAFSAPFVISGTSSSSAPSSTASSTPPSAGAEGSTPLTTGAPTATAGDGGPRALAGSPQRPATSSGGSLAYTGMPNATLWIVLGGAVLTLGGGLGRRVVRPIVSPAVEARSNP